MKAKLLLTFACCLMVQCLFAQKKAYEQGDLFIHAGTSLGYYGYGFTGNRSGAFIPVTASIEKGIHESISVGPYIGYASWKYSHYGYNYKWNFTSVGARGTFHAVPLLNEALGASISEEKLDLYGALLVGLEFRTFSGDEDFPGSYANGTNFFIGPVLGVKYKFNERVGVYFEGGRGAFGFGTLGVSINL
ncbi:hypothetical protein [Pontibacter ramchanderi]|uniref:Outer membrane protein with beta-barrel domain n=1 Tax=Pontibacter ramchanderi TaxID=1179743 RepID=A0A2N3V3V7_9BACT|nr:hypothetical protein [Pontibacter ramchanderi]PKV76298.1 hypothetical protein BD749_1249 [Pontibacter ramchanderi]